MRGFVHTNLLGCLLLSLMLLLQGCAKSASAVVDQADTIGLQPDVPVSVIIKMPAGRSAPQDLKDKAADWRKAGTVDSALWVSSSVEEQPTPGFAALLMLEFPNQRSYSSWLQQEGGKLPAPLVVRRADVLAQEKVAAYDPSITVFKVSYYTPKLSREFSTRWVEGYLDKYLNAQLQAGILVTYSMYLEHDAKEKGRLLLVLQYHDATIAAQAEPIKEKLNDALVARDSHYAALAEVKEKVRVTQSVTLAEYQPLPDR